MANSADSGVTYNYTVACVIRHENGERILSGIVEVVSYYQLSELPEGTLETLHERIMHKARLADISLLAAPKEA